MPGRFAGNRLLNLQSLGQSVWLDGVHRGMLVGSQFSRYVNREGISGVTSSPITLAAPYSEVAAYREPIAALRAHGASAQQIRERLSIDDVRCAADQLRRVYDHSHGRDGYATIDLPPAVADDAGQTESEARRLWSEIHRPNVMVKVPATDAGLLALPRLIAGGINVNATLIFGARRYREVADAFLTGLEYRVARNQALERVASVASFCVSRIDALIDGELDAIREPARAARTQPLRGRIAVAVARYAYQKYKSLIASARWRALAACGARTQRLLWVGTFAGQAGRETDVKYVNELIGRDTINTMSVTTLDAYRDHGSGAPTLERDLLDAVTLLAELQALDIDLDRASAQLQREALAAVAAEVNASLQRLA